MTLPLFVYGTLLTGGPAAGLLGDRARRVAAVRGTLYAMPAGYPALVLGGDGLVHGELVNAPDDRLLTLLDGYEGVDEGLYARVPYDVRVGLRSEAAWVYVMDPARARAGVRVVSGRWRNVRRR